MGIWQIIGLSVAITVLVVLFMGPGMWSSTTDPLVAQMWRGLKHGFAKVFGRRRE
ncbi:MAG TPA: hypothetical protein VGG33_15900 [Polyangia bacterium]